MISVCIPETIPNQTRSNVKVWCPFFSKQLAPIVFEKVRAQLDHKSKLIALDLEPFIYPAFCRFHRGDSAVPASRLQNVKRICRAWLLVIPQRTSKRISTETAFVIPCRCRLALAGSIANTTTSSSPAMIHESNTRPSECINLRKPRAAQQFHQKTASAIN